MSGEDSRIRSKGTSKFSDNALVPQADVLVCEEPLEIQIAGRTWVTVMRTPGDDFNLAKGLLFGEGIIANARDIQSIRHCSTVPTPEAEENILQIRLDESIHMDWNAQERHLFANASCGVCGKASLENLSKDLGPMPVNWRADLTSLAQMPEQMRKAQDIFESTGGLHAAALFSKDGDCIKVCEDIGRHNATDKVIGWGLSHDLSFADSILVVSGRISFEIAQKAWKAAVPILVAVSAASSLAVEVAEEANMGLMSFTRQGSGNCFGALQRFETTGGTSS
tara:strand:- start:370 stop:1209 length:840 start_codon:yes stop_codon:yes gene_type:complete